MFLKMHSIKHCCKCRLLTKVLFTINFKSDYQTYTFPLKDKTQDKETVRSCHLKPLRKELQLKQGYCQISEEIENVHHGDDDLQVMAYFKCLCISIQSVNTRFFQ